MSHLSLRFASRLLFLVGTTLLLLLSCQPPSGSSTGGINGTARFIGQSDHSGIIISVESVDNRGRTLAVRQAIAKGAVGNRAISAQATTDASGAYSLTGLAAGTYTVYASSRDSLEKAVATGVTVEAGKDVTASDLQLTPTGQISGTATLNGAVSGNLGIVVYIAGTSYAAISDNSGAFIISSVPVGTYTVYASLQGYNSANVPNISVTAGNTANAGTLNLTVAGAYGLTVVCPGGGITSPAGTIDCTQGVPVAITAVPSADYFFVSWAVVSGTVSFADASSATTTVTLTGGAATIQANFAREFLYVTAGSGALYMFSVSPDTGRLSVLNGSPRGGFSGPRFIASSKSGRFLYVANYTGNTIAALAIDRTTGQLTTVLTSPYGTASEPYSLAVDPDKNRLYCVSTDTTNWISVYDMDTSTGYLSPISGPAYQFAGQGTNQNGAAVDSTGSFFFTADTWNNTVSSYMIDNATGALTPVGSFPAGTGSAPQAVAAHPKNPYLYCANLTTSTVAAFSISSPSGALSPLGTPVAAGLNPDGLDIDPTGRFLYVGSMGSNSVSAFRIALDGTLSAISGSPFSIGTVTNSVNVDPSGKYLYTSDYNDNSIGVFSIDSTSGALQSVATYATTGSHPCYVRVVQTRF